MKKKRIITSIVLCGSLIGAFGAGALAASKINLIVNGKTANADVQIINGSSYVPLKAVAELLGANVKWDGNTKTITINSGSVPATKPAASTVGLSRSTPAPIGKTVTVTKKDILDNFTTALTLQEVIRGEAAWNKIKDANMFNDEPAEGHEYILAKYKINLISNADNGQIDFNSVSFTLVSKDGRDYDHPTIVEPDPQIDTKLYSGASHEGWVAFQVKKDDSNPLITFGRDYEGKDGAWFKLSE